MTQLVQYLRITLCLIALAGAASVHAQNASPPLASTSASSSSVNKIAPGKSELIMKIIEATNAKAASAALFDLMWQQSMSLTDSIYDQRIENSPEYTADQKSKAREYYRLSEPQVRERAKNYLKEKFDLDEFVVTSTLTLYDRYFTEAELQGILDFYVSPAGQKFVAVQPDLMKDSMADSYARIQSIMPDYMKFIQQQMQDQVAELEKLIKQIEPGKGPNRRGSRPRQRTN